MTELTFLKVLKLIRQVHQNKVLFTSISMSMNLIDIAILNIGSVLNIDSVDYHCIFNGISKSEAVNLLQNADFNEKNRTF